MSRTARWQTAVGAYAVAVLVVSVIPVAPKLAPGQLDKVAHLCEYLLLAWLIAQMLLIQQSSRRFLQAWIWATLYGGLIEGIQAFLPWRSADWVDGWLNALGALIGVGLARWYSPARSS